MYDDIGYDADPAFERDYDDRFEADCEAYDMRRAILKDDGRLHLCKVCGRPGKPSRYEQGNLCPDHDPWTDEWWRYIDEQ